MSEVPTDPIARKGNSNRDIDYICTECGRDVGTKNNLVAKTVSFRRIGKGGPTMRSRVVAWLCIIPNGAEMSCRDKDEAWSMPQRADSPGMKGTRLASKQGSEGQTQSDS